MAAAVFHGVDVSHFQGTITWATVAANKDFAIIKASGGDVGLYTDSQFTNYQTGARANGMKIGYYHFGSNGQNDAKTEADYFVGVINSLGNPLQTGEAVFLDTETYTYQGATYPPSDNWSNSFCYEVEAQLGFTCGIYMNQSTTNEVTWAQTAPITYLWLASWGIGDTNYSQKITAWSQNSPNYQWLQYQSGAAGAPPTYGGTCPGITGGVDLDSFYSASGSLNDWNLFGKPGTPAPPAPPVPAVPGVQTFAAVTNPTMDYTQPSLQTIAVPQYTYDRVLFSTSYVAPTITSSTWPQLVNGPTTNINQYAYPIGNYTASVNGGGALLNDFGFINAGDFGQFPGNLPTVVVQPIVDSHGNITFDVTVNNITGSVSVDLVLNFALLAYPNATTVPFVGVGQSIALSNAIAGGAPTAYATYRRIATDTSIGTGQNQIAHNQATIPNILYWVQDNTGTIEMQPVTWTSNGPATSFGISMDSSNIYFNVDAANNALCWYRLYRDN